MSTATTSRKASRAAHSVALKRPLAAKQAVPLVEQKYPFTWVREPVGPPQAFWDDLLASPEKSRAFFVSTGIWDEAGNLTPPYRRAIDAAAAD